MKLDPEQIQRIAQALDQVRAALVEIGQRIARVARQIFEAIRAAFWPPTIRPGWPPFSTWQIRHAASDPARLARLRLVWLYRGVVPC